jgi:hypothetical protein
MSTYTIPHAADTISNAITKVESTVTSGTLSSSANLVNSNVIKNYVDGQISTATSKEVNGVTTAGSQLFSKMFESAETVIPSTTGPFEISFNHNLGVTPLFVETFLKCISSNNGYLTGEFTRIVQFSCSYRFSNTSVGMLNNNNSLYVVDPNGTLTSPYLQIIGGDPIANNWRLITRAFA